MANDGTNFGPLGNLVGTWKGNGNGWNIIAVPTTPTDAGEPVAPGNNQNAILGSGFQLEIDLGARLRQVPTSHYDIVSFSRSLGTIWDSGTQSAHSRSTPSNGIACGTGASMKLDCENGVI